MPWRSLAEIPASTALSDAMSKELKQRGFSFVGSTICYAYMQAVGMVNDHVVGCFRHAEVKKLGPIIANSALSCHISCSLQRLMQRVRSNITQALNTGGRSYGHATLRRNRRTGYCFRRLVAAATAAADGPGERGKSPDRHRYSIEQAISDRAQLHTIAFDGLAFLTGDFGCDTFLPPGKVSDYFGFQYMRDIDAKEGGHNTSFLTRIADNMLAVLNDDQKAQLLALGKEQEDDIRRFAENAAAADQGVPPEPGGRPPRRQQGAGQERGDEVLGRPVRA